mmetsp:Transcript_7403/g.6642  ORF Transcript_7403/g.6642 Transcript_7403/m.6642 type:complete len:93 (+) Transcript_7403:20-298(+)
MLTRKLIIKSNLITTISKRFAGHGHKNIRFEELAGLRELTLFQFKFTLPVLGRLFFGLIIPFYIVYAGSSAEMKERDRLLHRKEREFGLSPF